MATTRRRDIHGLGTDPGDGTLYAATHFGVFRIPEQGTPTRIADRSQDTMGFTVVSPRQFLGSGHPEQRENKPNPLGLIASTDAGETWRDVALSGKADFHALEVAHGRIYGYDGSSGRLMVSRDKSTWDNRAVMPMADFAVDPENPDALVATHGERVRRQPGGGRRLAVVAGTPPVVFVSWPAPKALWGITSAALVRCQRTPALVPMPIFVRGPSRGMTGFVNVPPSRIEAARAMHSPLPRRPTVASVSRTADPRRCAGRPRRSVERGRLPWLHRTSGCRQVRTRRGSSSEGGARALWRR